MMEKIHWWGTRFCLTKNEIADFRLNLQREANIKCGIVAAGAVVAGVFGTPILGAAVGLYDVIMQTAVNDLLTELERWEYKEKAIVVDIPGFIIGYRIYA